LNAGIAALEQAIDIQSSGVGNHVAAGAAIDDAVNRGMTTVRKLDAIVRNKYADDRAVLAEWTSASHTERAPHHSAPSPQPPTPTPPAQAFWASRPTSGSPAGQSGWVEPVREAHAECGVR
jgi:hypothetical protein